MLKKVPIWLKWINALLVFVLCFSLGDTVVRADGMILPEAFYADYLVVRYHQVSVTIVDGHAVTRVEQEFFNPQSFPVDGRYLFPVPPEAMLSDLAVTVDGQTQTVVHQDAETTNRALFAVVTQREEPSLLQYIDWETLALDVSLPPGGARQMVLEYEEVLAPSGGLYHYHYVLSTERYTAQPLSEVSITVQVHSSAGLANIYSPSHPLTIERLGSGQARATWSAQDVQPSEDFHLFYAPAEDGFGGGLLTGRRNGHDHFLFLFSPQTEVAPEDTLPKDLIFVIDRSGSMSGEKIEQARSALHYILGRLDSGDRFSIVSYNDQVSLLAHTLQPAGRDALGEASSYVDRLNADGSTDIEAALEAGLQVMARSEDRGAVRAIVFLTDGLPTAGLTDDVAIAQQVAQSNAEEEVRLHVFGVGYDVNTHLLDRLASDSNGTVTYVQPGENLEAVLTGFYQQVAHPVLTDVEVSFEGMDVQDLYPQSPPDLFQGSSLLLAGRYRALEDTATVWVRGRVGGQVHTYVYHFDLTHVGGNDFVPRLWATRRVGALLDRVRVEGESQELADEIRELGLGYGLVTPYTTFVIEGQAAGAASAENMVLYQRADLNRVSGETTVQARVQNQAYQQANQANLAAGANVLNSGPNSLAQTANFSLDLSLLQGQRVEGAITEDWIAGNIGVDRAITFGSEEYFALAEDADARAFLQAGPNVIFRYQGEVIAVQTGELPLGSLPAADQPVQTDGQLLDSPGEADQQAPGRMSMFEWVLIVLTICVWFILWML